MLGRTGAQDMYTWRRDATTYHATTIVEVNISPNVCAGHPQVEVVERGALGNFRDAEVTHNCLLNQHHVRSNSQGLRLCAFVKREM